jgi:hypothetical protein
MARDRHIPGELPWGWWLRARDGRLEDEDGRTWRTVRDAFWQGELRFCEVHFAPEQHELMLRVMSAIDAPGIGAGESRQDLFAGDMMFWRFYRCWLAAIGMLDLKVTAPATPNPLSARLSPEGRSVLMMLRATRDPAWEGLPMAAVMEAVTAAGSGSDAADRETALRLFEDDVGFRRHLFARERVGRTHLITLTSMARGTGARMPTRRVTWSMSFTNATTRNDLFAWLACRIDRWDDWGEIAFRQGANSLTRHMLGMIVVAQREGTFQ